MVGGRRIIEVTRQRRRHTPEQVIRKLREAERMLSDGKELAEVAKALEGRRLPITAGATSTAA
jgi:hypothetical protein